jgi:hypothetical protein
MKTSGLLKVKRVVVTVLRPSSAVNFIRVNSKVKRTHISAVTWGVNTSALYSVYPGESGKYIFFFSLVKKKNWIYLECGSFASRTVGNEYKIGPCAEFVNDLYRITNVADSVKHYWFRWKKIS